MHAVKECSVRSHFRRKRIKKAGGLEKDFHTLIDVPDKDHGSRGRNLLFSTCKGSGCHIVLHDLDAILVLEVNSSDLIKSDTIPEADQADLTPAHIVEKIGNRRLPARHENTVRRDLLIQMRFSSAARTKLAEWNGAVYRAIHPL